MEEPVTDVAKAVLTTCACSVSARSDPVFSCTIFKDAFRGNSFFDDVIGRSVEI